MHKLSIIGISFVWSPFIAVLVMSNLVGCSTPGVHPVVQARVSKPVTEPATPRTLPSSAPPLPPAFNRPSPFPPTHLGSPLLNAVGGREAEKVKAFASKLAPSERGNILGAALFFTLDTSSTVTRYIPPDPAMFRLLLTLGADIDYPKHFQGQTYSRTFLIEAIANQDRDMAALALDYGADPNLNVRGSNALATALYRKDQQSFDLLLSRGARPDVVAIAAAARNPGPLNANLRRIIKLGARYKTRAGFEAVLRGFAVNYEGKPEDAEETLRIILSMGYKIDRRRPQYWNESLLVASVTSIDARPEVIRALIKHGANPNQGVLYALAERYDYSSGKVIVSGRPFDAPIPMRRRDILDILFEGGARVSKTPKNHGCDVRNFFSKYGDILKSDLRHHDIEDYIVDLDEMTRKYIDRRALQWLAHPERALKCGDR